MMILSDACAVNVPALARVINCASRVTLKIVASLTINIYDGNMFKVQATVYIVVS
jgi:hypothetical protein